MSLLRLSSWVKTVINVPPEAPLLGVKQWLMSLLRLLSWVLYVVKVLLGSSCLVLGGGLYPPGTLLYPHSRAICLPGPFVGAPLSPVPPDVAAGGAVCTVLGVSFCTFDGPAV